MLYATPGMTKKTLSSEKRRPRIVTIGGGTGHFALLSGLKKHDVDLTAIVSMADDGGSTGQLRDELGVLPPGDLRQCLVALSEGDELMRKLFTHRFSSGGSLKGHTFGNLFLSTLEHVTGSINEAVAEVGRILKIRGRVLPVTLDTTSLYMVLDNGKRLKGEHVIDEYQLISRFGIKEIGLNPLPVLNPAVRDVLRQADMVVIGPGDLYTSIIPNLLVPGLVAALKRSRAKKVFIVNLMNKHGHTDDFDAAKYVQEIEHLSGARFLTTALYNTTPIPPSLVKRYVDDGEPVVQKDLKAMKGVKFVGANVVSATFEKPKKGDSLRRTFIRHDSDKLAAAIMKLL